MFLVYNYFLTLLTIQVLLYFFVLSLKTCFSFFFLDFFLQKHGVYAFDLVNTTWFSYDYFIFLLVFYLLLFIFCILIFAMITIMGSASGPSGLEYPSVLTWNNLIFVALLPMLFMAMFMI